ncbi:MAG: sulfatase [Acidobacteria bacterium]|nr:sulfatase [Acidobacteriota bacterium]
MPNHLDFPASRRDMLRLLAAGGLSSLALPAQTRRPNFVLLFADDLGWGDVGFDGRRTWPTPNLDRLAAQGTTFTRWYTGMPLCAPSRACLLTGKYNIHNGVVNNSQDLPAAEVTIAEALQPLGYATALFGKWHRGRLPDGSFTHPLDQGFDETFGFLDAKHAWEHFPKFLYRGRQQEKTSGYTADIFSDEAIRFMRQNRNRPFFLYLPYIESHFLIEAPEEDIALFRGKFKEKDPSKPLNATYAAMVYRMDKGIGRVMKALDEFGLADNTVVLFTSDNGATFESGAQGTSHYHDSNFPFRGQKRSLEEGGIRVPGVVRWPGKVPAGRKCEEPVHNMDVFPTFLAAAGGTPDPAWKVDGANLLDAWQGKVSVPQRTLFWEWSAEGYDMRAAMRGDLKLLETGNNRFLYNVREDPAERRTVFAEYPELFKQLQAEWKAWKATEVKR